MELVEKQSREKQVLTIDYSSVLPSGVTVSSGVVEAVDGRGADVAATLLTSTTATTTSTTAKAVLQNGTNGERYKITMLATLSDGQVLEDDVFLLIKDV